MFVVFDDHRILCKQHGILSEAVPWAEHHCNFTKDFEKQVSYLSLHSNKTEVSKIMLIAWNTVGPILRKTKRRLEADSKIRNVEMTRKGIDETSYCKGHKYLNVVTSYDTG